MKEFFVYITASGRNGTLYIGVTNNLNRRITEHKSGEPQGFTKKYQVNKLVYYENFPDARSAIIREKNMKAWKRKWKIELIEKHNPKWKDIAEHIEQKEV